ncbi:MAG TPA: DUF72 domain-containing protein [Chthonomonadaceae bacterium]|nr:DUF72 domain-containing protein [Chthonomonadaceae bacterium]
MRGPALWIGTSGWVYKHWQGLFYPSELPAGQQLAFYAGHFSTVEINSSYYRLPEPSVFAAWRAQTPEGFLFAVKASRYLTHLKKLKDFEEPLQRLMNHASGLQEKLGPVLFQFPRTWPPHLERLEPFLAALQAYPDRRFAFEFRHSDWLAEPVYALLERAGAALCLPVHPQMPLQPRLTAPWTYIRMHYGRGGWGFAEEELAEWAGRIRAFLGQNADVYVYFNNDPEGHALRNALRLRQMLNA